MYRTARDYQECEKAIILYRLWARLGRHAHHMMGMHNTQKSIQLFCSSKVWPLFTLYMKYVYIAILNNNQLHCIYIVLSKIYNFLLVYNIVC